MITVVLLASMIVVMDPPEAAPCAPAGLTVRLADGEELIAVSVSYLPDSLGVVITPAASGRVFCSGFEVSP